MTTADYFIVNKEDCQSQMSKTIEANGEISVKIKFAPNVAEKRYFRRTGELTVGYINHPNAVNVFIKIKTMQLSKINVLKLLFR